MWQGGGPHSSSCPSPPRHLSKFHLPVTLCPADGTVGGCHRPPLETRDEEGAGVGVMGKPCVEYEVIRAAESPQMAYEARILIVLATSKSQALLPPRWP